MNTTTRNVYYLANNSFQKLFLAPKNLTNLKELKNEIPQAGAFKAAKPPSNSGVLSMPTKQLHLAFDQYLADHGTIQKRDYSLFHNWIERELQVSGHWNQSYEVYYYEIEELICCIRKRSDSTLQEIEADHVKVALGHLILDERWTKYWYNNDYELMKSAFRSFVHRGFTRFRIKEQKNSQKPVDVPLSVHTPQFVTKNTC